MQDVRDVDFIASGRALFEEGDFIKLGAPMWFNPSSMEMIVENVRIADLKSAEENPRVLSPHYRAQLKLSLSTFGWLNPIIVNRVTGRILTGHQRTTVAKEDLGWEWAPATFVNVSPEHEQQVVIFLNDISGNWHFKMLDKMQNQHYAQMGRVRLGSAYTGNLFPNEVYDDSKPEHVKAVKAYLGDTVVDYGAGKMKEFKMLEKIGIKGFGYDPFQKDPNRPKYAKASPSLAHTRSIADEFFAELIVNSEKGWTVVNQAVLSSIAYTEVRSQVCAILGALTYAGGRFASITARSITDSAYNEQRISLRRKNRGKDQNIMLVPDDSEPNLFVSGVSLGQQIHQKYFTLEEFEELLQPHFTSIDVEMTSKGMVYAQCWNDAPPDMDYLEFALEQQFGELKIDGQPIDKADEAIAAFRHILEARKAAL